MPPVIRYRGWNISLVICYDLRFPVWCRNVNNRYDMLIVPANWPSARGYAWRQLLIARAIENQAVIVGADRSGCDDYGDYEYMSYVFDPSGHEIAPCDKSDGKCPNRKSSDIFYATYTIDAVNRMRISSIKYALFGHLPSDYRMARSHDPRDRIHTTCIRNHHHHRIQDDEQFLSQPDLNSTCNQKLSPGIARADGHFRYNQRVAIVYVTAHTGKRKS